MVHPHRRIYNDYTLAARGETSWGAPSIGLAYHLASARGTEQREILLDFSLTVLNLDNNYRALKVDPWRADALILSHGHMDHYGALPVIAEQGKLKPGVTLCAGGEDTFCHRIVVTPAAARLKAGAMDSACSVTHFGEVKVEAKPGDLVSDISRASTPPRTS